MASLSLHLMGPFTATLNDQPLNNFKTNKVQALLIYLAVEKEHTHRREALFTLLWPGMPEKSARHNLSQTLYALRQTFPAVSSDGSQEEVPLILADRQTIQLNPQASVDTDLHQLARLLQKTQTHEHMNLEDCQPCIQSLEQAVSLYQGDFLAGFYLEDSNQFEDWAASTREAYSRKALEALQTLTDIAIQKNEYDQASAYAERQLAIDKLNESAHRQLMEILARSDRRVEALRQYREYVHILDDELGVPPSLETTALYGRIQAEVLPTAPPVHIDAKPEPTSAPRHNLTPQPTPFIGREAELADLDRLIADPQVRLITIVGPGGMGKTRLAIACGEQQFNRTSDGDNGIFPDGVFFVPLASVDSADQIPIEVAKALGLSGRSSGMVGQSGDTITASLLDFLLSKQILLILDNFEQLLEGDQILIQIFQVAPDVQFLVTSRERLYLQEEQVFPLQGMVFPDWEAPEEPFDYPAMQLFLQSARRVRPDFRLKQGDMIYLTRISRLVGGMPLALELAAAWVDLLSLAEIVAEIQGSLDFLETSLRNLPTRQRSMRVVCTSTWEHLNESEKRVYAQLSVYQGGFNRAAAQEVCKATLRDLAGLVNKSLLQYNPTTERYQIHELLRQYGAEKLAEDLKDERNTRDRHSTYFCDQLRQHNNKMMAGEFQQAIECIQSDLANVQIGWEWAIQQGSIDNLTNALDGIFIYYDRTLQLQKGLDCCQSVIEMLANKGELHFPEVKISDEMTSSARLYAKALSHQGYCYFYSDHSKARESLARSIAILEKLLEKGCDVRYEKAYTLWLQGIFEFQFGDPSTVKQNLLESYALSREIESQGLTFYILAWLGHSEIQTGSMGKAQKWFEQLLSEAREYKNPSAEIWALIGLGDISRRLMDYRQAEHLFEQGVEVARKSNDHVIMFEPLGSLCSMILFLGRLEEVIERLNEGVALAKRNGLSRFTFNMQIDIGVVYWLCGDLENAGAVFEETLSLNKRRTSNPNIFAIISYANYLTITGNYIKAFEQMQFLKSLTQDTLTERFIPGQYLSGMSKETLGWISLAQENNINAVSNFNESLEVFSRIGDKEWIARSQAGLARAEIESGDKEGGHQLLEKALSTSIEIQGYIPMVFSLPITLLILAEEDTEFAKKVYTQVRRDPFMSKARLFHDLVYQHLPEEMTAVPVEMVQHSPEHRSALWETARLVLEKWCPECVERGALT